MLTSDQRQMIQNLKRLSQNARKAPWYQGGNVGRDGKRVYKVAKPEEDLIILMRNSVDELIKIIEQQEEVLSFYANPLNYEQYSIYEQTSPIEQDNGDRARLGFK